MPRTQHPCRRGPEGSSASVDCRDSANVDRPTARVAVLYVAGRAYTSEPVPVNSAGDVADQEVRIDHYALGVPTRQREVDQKLGVRAARRGREDAGRGEQHADEVRRDEPRRIPSHERQHIASRAPEQIAQASLRNAPEMLADAGEILGAEEAIRWGRERCDRVLIRLAHTLESYYSAGDVPLTENADGTGGGFPVWPPTEPPSQGWWTPEDEDAAWEQAVKDARRTEPESELNQLFLVQLVGGHFRILAHPRWPWPELIGSLEYPRRLG